ncbi:MAG: hypothetical protein WAL15_13120 [Xanthobacteraceae bacterium]|jgi:hypothetical protein
MRNRIAQRQLKLIASFAVLYGLTLLPLPAAAQGTPEQQANCQDDAMRLCGQFVPDVNRITSCMIAKRRLVSARCRATMAATARAQRRVRN